VMRGDRIGLVGNNGVGKSTLLKIMLGEITPDTGTVKVGTNLEIAYFDQLRRSLDPEKTVAQIIGDGSDYIKLNGKPRHVIGYLRGFLFSAKRAMTKVKVLSGGEKNRVILAKLLTRPSNLLVLDEPTNDLDIETLEVLEDKLLEYQGTLIIVTHDREFLDNVVSSILVFEDSGIIQNYAGGFSDWHRRGIQLAETDNPDIKKPVVEKTENKKNTNKKLTYKLKFELDSLPEKIVAFEEEIKKLISIQKINQTINYVEFPGIDSLKLGRRDGDFLGDIHIPHMYYFSSYVFENLMERYGFKKLYLDSEIKGLFIYNGNRGKLKNFFYKVKEDLIIAEKKRKYTGLKNFVKLMIPNKILNLKRKIYKKNINY